MKFLIALAFLFSPVSRAFEFCTEQNSYLENLLPNAGPEPYSHLPSACVERAQLNLPATGFYGFCPSLEGMPGRTHPRPCISEKYVRAVHSALVDASECLGYDPRWAFASFNLESALHINAVGAAGDVGVGQLTKSAIDQINARARGLHEEMIRKSSIPACKRLLGYIKPHSGEPSQRCGFMNLPENPRRNLIYSILLLRDNRKLIERYFQRLDIRLPDHVDINRLQHQLAKLAYNSGAAGLAASLKAYVDQMDGSLGPHHFHFENLEATSYASYLGRNFPVKEGRESTRKRIAKYMKYVIASARKVDNQLGGGVCLSPEMFPPLGPHPVDRTPAPDSRQAKRLIGKYLLKLADRSEAFKKRDCKEAQAQFRFEFVPTGLEPEDLPRALYRRYLMLCGG